MVLSGMSKLMVPKVAVDCVGRMRLSGSQSGGALFERRCWENYDVLLLESPNRPVVYVSIEEASQPTWTP